MSFETISLLLNWVQLGVLLAILFRLHHTFDLIANTQRQLRRAIHHLGGDRTAEPRNSSSGPPLKWGSGSANGDTIIDTKGAHKAVGLDEVSWAAHGYDRAAAWAFQ